MSAASIGLGVACLVAGWGIQGLAATCFLLFVLATCARKLP